MTIDAKRRSYRDFIDALRACLDLDPLFNRDKVNRRTELSRFFPGHHNLGPNPNAPKAKTHQ